jgi:hypothetical protein
VDALLELPYWLAIAGWMGGFGLASARAARQAERRPSIWFGIGAIIGPIALLIIGLAPPGRCRTCGTPTRGWARTCWWCHEDVRSTPASTRAILDRMSGRIAPLEKPPLPVRRREPARPFVIQANPVEQSMTNATAPRPGATPATRSSISSRTPWSEGASVPTSSAPHEVVEPRRSIASPEDRPAAAAVVAPALPTGESLRVMATAVFVAGGARLEPGHRYGLAVRSGRFLVLGPTDVDPLAVVVDRDVADVEVRIVEGRLVVSEPRGRSGFVLAFMSVAGASAADVASAITEAARPGGRN